MKKKMLLGLGASFAILLPIASVIACGSETTNKVKEKTTPETTTPETTTPETTTPETTTPETTTPKTTTPVNKVGVLDEANKFDYSFINNQKLLQNDKFWTLPDNSYSETATKGNPKSYYSAMKTVVRDTKNIYPQMSFEDWYNTYDTSFANIQKDPNHPYASTAPKNYNSRGSQWDIYKPDADLSKSGTLPKTGNNNNPYNALYSGAGFAYPSKTFNLLAAATPNGQYIPTNSVGNGWEHMTPQSKIRSVLTRGTALAKLARGDLHNLRPSIQNDFNSPRSNNMYGMVKGDGWKNGVDFEMTSDAKVTGNIIKLVEPRVNVRGDVARDALYMHDRYHITFDQGFYKLMILWAAMDPVTPEERSFEAVIKSKMGFSNDYVTGKKQLPVVPEITKLLTANKVVSGYTSTSVGDTSPSGNPITSATPVVGKSAPKNKSYVQSLDWSNPSHTFTTKEKPSKIYPNSQLIGHNFYLRIKKPDNSYQYLIVTTFQGKAMITKDFSENKFKVSISGRATLGIGSGSSSYKSMTDIQEVLIIKE